MWPLINENKPKLDKNEKKMQNYVILVFSRKKFISKDKKAIKYKIKNLNRFFYSSKGSPRDPQLSRTCLTSTTNINYIKKLCPFLNKKLNNKVKIASYKTENKQKTCNSPEKNGYSPVRKKNN